MGASTLLVGYIAAIVSSVLSGSWQAAVKSTAITKHQLHPAILNIQFMFGFFVASWFAMIDSSQSFNFSWWGILSATLFDASMSLNIAVSFPILGIAVGSGIASSTAIITSLVWSIILDEGMRSIWVTCVGVFVVVMGVNGIIFTGRYFALPVKAFSKLKMDTTKLATVNASEGNNDQEQGGGGETTPLINTYNSSRENTTTTADSEGGQEEGEEEAMRRQTEAEEVDKKTFMTGVLGAVSAGLFGGSYLIPNLKCCADADTEFLPSVGIGCVLIGPVFSMFISYALPHFNPELLKEKGGKVWPTSDVLLQTTPWGMLPGIVNVLAVILIIKAMDDIDYVVANTIAQCSVFVSGIWGWLLYAELDAKTWGVVCFFVSSTLLVGGASIVAYYGTSK